VFIAVENLIDDQRRENVFGLLVCSEATLKPARKGRKKVRCAEW
jgi:hypothetical protein